MKIPFLTFSLLLLILMSLTTEAYDALDPTGNITILWDIKSWTYDDGYVADVTIYNFQQFRNIHSPGWELGWAWQDKEVIWDIRGGETTEQGDCSMFDGESLPHSCVRKPTVVDLSPGTPYNQQVSNCCKGGVISAWGQDSKNAISTFRISIGESGTRSMVLAPANFTLKAPGALYTCNETTQVNSSIFISPDGRRKTQALLTWSITCQFKAKRTPTCCMSLSSFYNSSIVKCPTCSCGCQDVDTCAQQKITSVVPDFEQSVQCTSHMCPIRVHWHVKVNYREYWRVKLTVTNFHYNTNYTQWNMVVQHPNFDNLTQLFSFNHKFLNPYVNINDTVMMWGVSFFNDKLIQASPQGNVQSELLFRKNPSQFTLAKGWAFPRRIYFNGDLCVMPPTGSYPRLPNSTPNIAVSPFIRLVITLFPLLVLM